MASKTFNISLPEDLVTKIDIVAKNNFMSRSELIRYAVVKEIKTEESQWESIIDFTTINTSGVNAKDILDILKTLK